MLHNYVKLSSSLLLYAFSMLVVEWAGCFPCRPHPPGLFHLLCSNQFIWKSEHSSLDQNILAGHEIMMIPLGYYNFTEQFKGNWVQVDPGCWCQSQSPKTNMRLNGKWAWAYKLAEWCGYSFAMPSKMCNLWEIWHLDSNSSQTRSGWGSEFSRVIPCWPCQVKFAAIWGKLGANWPHQLVTKFDIWDPLMAKPKLGGLITFGWQGTGTAPSRR